MTNRENDKQREKRKRERELDMDSFTTHCHAVLHGGMRGTQQLRVETLTLKFQLIASHRRNGWLNAAATAHDMNNEERRSNFRSGSQWKSTWRTTKQTNNQTKNVETT